MPTWLLLAVGAQIIYAVVAIFDKYIVTSKKILKPISYAFYISILSAFSVVIFLLSWIKLPFSDLQIPSFYNLTSPSILVLVMSLLSGFAMFQALFYLFKSLSRADTSDVVPVIGAVSAMVTLVLEFLFLDCSFTENTLIGFGLLLIGTLLVSSLRFKLSVFLMVITSGSLFAIYYTAIKFIFNLTNFDTGFLYSRFGLAIAALLILLLPKTRKAIFENPSKTPKRKRKAGVYVLLNKTFSGIASIMTLKAVELGSVAIVQALSGVQFIFLILFSVTFGRVTPYEFGENVTIKDVMQKVLAVFVIIFGLFFMFL